MSDYPQEINVYLDQVTAQLQEILQSNLVGFYIYGSSVQSDYRDGKSDLDLICIVKDPLNDRQKKDLANELVHSKLPVPACGMDIIFVTEENVRNLKPEPEYEFWFSTGALWNTEIEENGKSSELLIFFANCYANGKKIFGLESKNAFRDVPFELLLFTIIDILNWHRIKILDDFHDPLGQYSVLNAARAWMYVQEKKLGSKSEGGEWVLSREPQNQLVRNALQTRKGVKVKKPNKEEIDAFLLRILNICQKKL